MSTAVEILNRTIRQSQVAIPAIEEDLVEAQTRVYELEQAIQNHRDTIVSCAATLEILLAQK